MTDQPKGPSPVPIIRKLRRPSNKDIAGRRCVAWDKSHIVFCGIQAVMLPAHMQRAPWVAVQRWARAWIGGSFGANKEQLRKIEKHLRDVPQWELEMINGIHVRPARPLPKRETSDG